MVGLDEQGASTMNDNDCGRMVINELMKAYKYIKTNWNDPVGEGYIAWLDTVLSDIRGMEQRKESIIINGEKIKQLCEQMISDDDAFERKRKRNC